MSFLRLTLLFLSVAHAQPKPSPAPTGFWKVLVTPKAKWTLTDTVEDKQARIVVETYDVRKVGGADVARLRWTHIWGPGKKDRADIGGSDGGRYTQVAVTAAGLYILSADMDDTKILEALKRKPSRSDPPKAYKGTRQNEGRYLHVEGDDLVCLGYEPLPNAPDCPDTCFGEVCISPTRGPVKLSGTWAPGNGIYEQ